MLRHQGVNSNEDNKLDSLILPPKVSQLTFPSNADPAIPSGPVVDFITISPGGNIDISDARPSGPKSNSIPPERSGSTDSIPILPAVAVVLNAHNRMMRPAIFLEQFEIWNL